MPADHPDHLLLRVRFRSIYGREQLYPANQAAEAIAAIAGTATIVPSVLRIAVRQLGAKVVLDDSSEQQQAALQAMLEGK